MCEQCSCRIPTNPYRDPPEQREETEEVPVVETPKPKKRKRKPGLVRDFTDFLRGMKWVVGFLLAVISPWYAGKHFLRWVDVWQNSIYLPFWNYVAGIILLFGWIPIMWIGESERQYEERQKE